MLQTNGKKVLQVAKTQAVYVSCEYLIRYITGFVAEDGLVVVDKNGTTLYTDKRYIEAAKKRGDALDHVGNVEHADTAGLVQVNRLGSLVDVHTSADGLDTQVGSDFAGRGNALSAGVHGMVVANGPDIGVHILQDFGGSGVHSMEEHTPGTAPASGCPYRRSPMRPSWCGS